ncbi:hypothetical protein Leryth_019000 [Lithospermum erythrorhizon]|nr:hypothetical protein Leryth_019000 [Lithospermum erythrorhizon]
MPRGVIEPLELSVQIPYHFRCPIFVMTPRQLQSLCRPTQRPTRILGGHREHQLPGYSSSFIRFHPHSQPYTPPSYTRKRCVGKQASHGKSRGSPHPSSQPTLLWSVLCSTKPPLQVRPPSLSASSALERRPDNLKPASSIRKSPIISTTNVRQLLLSIAFSNHENRFIDLSHESISILSMFNLSESECAFVGSVFERVTYLVSLLFHSSIEVRVNSAALLEIVLTGTRSPELRAQICDADDIFIGVVGILRIPLASPRALKIGIKALFALCLVKQHRHKAISAGAVEALMEKLAEFEKCDAERALATIELLCRIQSGCAALSAHALTVPLLVKIILKVSERATEYAAGALLSLCSAYEQSQQDAVAAGVLTQLLLLVQSDCTERAKRKAQTLLKLLRHSWPQDSIANSDDYACSNVAGF